MNQPSPPVSAELPEIICGPLIRRCTENRVVVWWISSGRFETVFCGYYRGEQQPFLEMISDSSNTEVRQVGNHAYVNLMSIRPEQGLPLNVTLEYDLMVKTNPESREQSLAELAPGILYQGEVRPSFVIRKTINKLLHGSCRNPHHASDDSFMGADREVGRTINHPENRPAVLILTGDQIYADDVAGPLLQAIHQVTERLGLFREVFNGANIPDSETLYQSPDCYYLRKNILPKTTVGNKWYNRGGLLHIFTSASAHNHLISFAEWMAMYMLVWSPALWKLVTFSESSIPEQFRAEFRQERKAIEAFKQCLPNVRRLLAHIPSYMIFDDHDVTDDWNLTARWEMAAYGNPFTKRIIGNALIAYWLCQGWGNHPEKFSGDEFGKKVDAYFLNPSQPEHDALIDYLIVYERWNYDVPTSPKLVVIDSRTQRWRSEKSTAKPSGLLDWEAMMKFQQKLVDLDAVIMVAPAPVFGVKLIELIQRIFTTFGYSLTVDAENWMAHPGTAYTLMQIFKNRRTPRKFVILSGDVHYSFVYDVKIRFRKSGPEIWQITSSGIKNEFPGNLLKILDFLNRIFYGYHSPLNFFTKRRSMRIRSRKPQGKKKTRLVNTSGIGMVSLADDGSPTEICELYANGDKMIFFPRKND